MDERDVSDDSSGGEPAIAPAPKAFPGAGPVLLRAGVNPASSPSAAPTEHDFHQTYFRSLHEILDFAPIAYLVTDSRGIITEANHTAGELLNVSRDYLLDKPLGLFVVSQDTRRFYRLMAEMGRSRLLGRRNAEFRIGRHGGGGVVSIAATVESLDLTGGGHYYRWLIRDISARVAAERGLQAERSFADALLEIVPSYILVLDREGLILRANAWAQSNLSDSDLSLVGASWTSFLPVEDQGDALAIIWHSFHDESINRLQTRLRKADGELRAVRWLLKSHAGADGKQAILAVGHDITDLEEAQAKKVHSERLAAVGEFVTMLAHESRNALQRAQGCLDRLTWRLTDQPEALDLARRAKRAHADLNRLFEDIRVFTTSIPLTQQRSALRDAWRDAWHQLMEVREGGAALREPEIDGDLSVRGDSFRLIQVFRNLFENSLDAGAQAVQIDVEESNSSQFVRIVVRDNGHGLREADRARVFDPFFTTKAHGSGLGMSICRRIIAAHGGEIRIQGMANAKGTEVIIMLPRGEVCHENQIARDMP